MNTIKTVSWLCSKPESVGSTTNNHAKTHVEKGIN
jgi:hypothetical protein